MLFFISLIPIFPSYTTSSICSTVILCLNLLCRIEFDDEVQNKLNNTLDHMKHKFLEISYNRDDVDEEIYEGYNWMVDFEPDSVINLKLRKKKDVTNFALNNEGNLYNSLFNKVQHC